MFAAAETTYKAWVYVVSNVGFPVGLLLFLCLVAWKLLPHIISWFKATTAQSHAVHDAVPEIKKSLASIATDAGGIKILVARGERLEGRMDSLEQRTKRIEQTAGETLHEIRKGGMDGS